MLLDESSQSDPILLSHLDKLDAETTSVYPAYSSHGNSDRGMLIRQGQAQLQLVPNFYFAGSIQQTAQYRDIEDTALTKASVTCKHN